jgi:hypothetical protein
VIVDNTLGGVAGCAVCLSGDRDVVEVPAFRDEEAWPYLRLPSPVASPARHAI